MLPRVRRVVRVRPSVRGGCLSCLGYRAACMNNRPRSSSHVRAHILPPSTKVPPLVSMLQGSTGQWSFRLYQQFLANWTALAQMINRWSLFIATLQPISNITPPPPHDPVKGRAQCDGLLSCASSSAYVPRPSAACQPDFERAGGIEPWRRPSPSPANASPSDLRLAPTTFAPLSLLSIAEWIIARFIVDEEREERTTGATSQSASSSSTPPSPPTSSRRMTIRKIISRRRCDDLEDLISLYGQTTVQRGAR